MMLVIVGGLKVMSAILLIGTFVFLTLSGLSIIRKKSHLKSVGLIVSSLLLFAGSYHINETIEAEQIAIEQAEIRAEEERVRIAEEKKQAEIAKQKELERIEEQKAIRVKVLSSLDKVEAEPTLENYNAVTRNLNALEDKSEIKKRLDEIKPAVDAYEETVLVAREAIIHAETEKSRSTYEEANKLVSSLSIPHKGLNSRLNQLDIKLVEAEAEQLAADKAAEKQRIAEASASEEAARIATAEKASQQAAQRASKKAEPIETASAPADNNEKTVYIAPHSGTKYHYSASCRGLNNANSVKKISLSEAKNQGYDLCGWE